MYIEILIVAALIFFAAEYAGNNLLYLPSDFKKKDGYKLSIELSEKYGLYRQNN